ncbi:MAG TPA: undecaprenyl-diphosphate phosphatase [Verrucomicrobiae bacterium]|nr:undecaprenyl-diphosphate phosphatase [Verrucomicrobiae bacterium]
MTIFEAIVLGLVQGLTEFIPVSSSGHLIIGQYLFGGNPDHLFIEYINIGTVLALLIYFRKRISAAIRDVVIERNFQLLRNVVITAIPAGVVGFTLSDIISSHPFFTNVWVVIASLVVVGTIMIVLEKLPKKSHITDGENLPKSRALVIGLAQVAALVPGVSRSGSTIIAGRLMGLDARKAAEYSFLVSIPIMLGVITKLLIKESDRLYAVQHLPQLVMGNVVALISGLLAVGFLMKYLETNSLKVFGIYRIIIALVLAVFLLLQ